MMSLSLGQGAVRVWRPMSHLQCWAAPKNQVGHRELLWHPPQVHHLVVAQSEFSPQSESGLSAGREQGLGGAEVKVDRMEQDHTADLLVTSDTRAQNPPLRRNLDSGLLMLSC